MVKVVRVPGFGLASGPGRVGYEGGMVGDHFQLSSEFLFSLPSCFTFDLDWMSCLCFCFCVSEHL